MAMVMPNNAKTKGWWWRLVENQGKHKVAFFPKKPTKQSEKGCTVYVVEYVLAVIQKRLNGKNVAAATVTFTDGKIFACVCGVALPFLDQGTFTKWT